MGQPVRLIRANSPVAYKNRRRALLATKSAGPAVVVESRCGTVIRYERLAMMPAFAAVAFATVRGYVWKGRSECGGSGLEPIEVVARGRLSEWRHHNKGQKNGYGCTGTGLFREKGVYEQDVSMKSFWENDSIVWSEGIKQMDLVIKDNSGGRGHAHKRPDHEKFFPTKVRITMVQVSAGSTYDPTLVPNLPPASKESGAKSKDEKTSADAGSVTASTIASVLPAAKVAAGCRACGEHRRT